MLKEHVLEEAHEIFAMKKEELLVSHEGTEWGSWVIVILPSPAALAVVANRSVYLSDS